MKLMKNLLMFSLVTVASLAAFADPVEQASDDAKLALLMSDSSRLQAVNISAEDDALQSELKIDGDETSSMVIRIKMNDQIKSYVVTRDGGGQIISITLSK